MSSLLSKFRVILPLVLLWLPPPLCHAVETFASRSYFYVGGHYENTVSLVTFRSLMVDQMYVEKLVPVAQTQKYPLFFITGAAQSGTNWLNTPDGREGWASYFLNQGYTLYLTDQPQRGRSPWLPGDGTLTNYNVSFIQDYFTTVQVAKLWPQASLHTQWPGNGVPSDPTFDAFFASQLQQQSNLTIISTNNVHAGISLLKVIGPAILITHSHGGPYGWGITDAVPDLVKAIIAIEPEGPPFVGEIVASGKARPYGVTTLPITYDPPVSDPTTDLVTEVVASGGAGLSSCIRQQEPAKKLINLIGVPVLVMTSEASYHAVYDYCTVEYLKQAGVQVDWLSLPAVGIHGNAHFSFMELNNMEIVPLINDWIQKHV
ncbi:alpha/beta-hydrolase [Stipitochalara longipes BDJ]|nr:alpha/beta-hydrolase [Stipitochalara longipes BDJ]